MGWFKADPKRFRENLAKARGALHGEPVLPVTPVPQGVGPIIDRSPAARMVGGKPVWGGDLEVRTDAVVFRPIDVDHPVRFYNLVLPRLGVPGVAVKGAEALLNATGLREAQVIRRNEIASVEVLHDARLTKPPTMRMTLTNGQQHDYGVVVGQATPSIRSSNNVARNRMVNSTQQRPTGRMPRAEDVGR
jgi:hypothetical protein